MKYRDKDGGREIRDEIRKSGSRRKGESERERSDHEDKRSAKLVKGFNFCTIQIYSSA